ALPVRLPGLFRELSRLAVAVHGNIDQPWVDLAESPGPDPHFLHGARSEGFDEHVGLFYEMFQDFPALRLPDVESYVFLAPALNEVGKPRAVNGFAERRHLPRDIPPGRFHPYDPRAKFGQKRRGKQPRKAAAAKI